jgi:predicted CopG family antitoxin
MDKESKKRERVFTAKMTDNEYSNLQEVARLEGSSMSDFIRRATLQKKREYQRENLWEK